MNPLHQFQVKKWIHWQVMGLDLSMTNSSFFMVLTAGLVLLGLRLFLGKRRKVPGDFQVLGEATFDFIDHALEDVSTDPQEARSFSPMMASLFLFLLGGNLVGMVPGAFTFTSQIIVTFALALGLFIAMVGIGLKKQGLGFFRIFLPKEVPWVMAPLFIPIECISYLSRPLSLGVRLFANMMAGHAMMKIFAYFTLSVGVFGVIPFSINVALTGFEVMVAFLQAYVFTVLSCIYLRDSLSGH